MPPITENIYNLYFQTGNVKSHRDKDKQKIVPRRSRRKAQSGFRSGTELTWRDEVRSREILSQMQSQKKEYGLSFGDVIRLSFNFIYDNGARVRRCRKILVRILV